MSPVPREELWRQLSEAGLAQGELPERGGSTSPWYVRTMLGVAGWIGALFLLGFVGAGLAFVFRNEAAALVVGALCCAASFAIFKKGGRNDLASQFGLAISLAGQVMFIYGLGLNRESPLLFLAVAMFESLLAWLLNNFVHRVWSTFAASVALGYAANMMGLYGFGSTLVAGAAVALWLDEDKLAARGTFWRAIGYGLAFALVQPTSYVAQWFFWGPAVPPAFGTFTPWIKGVLLAGVLVYLVRRLLAHQGIAPSNRTGGAALAAAAIVGAATLRSPGITSSLIIVLLGFARGSRALFGLGVLALLSYLSYFYYSLQMTLLMKSIALAATGVVLIVLWAVMRAMFGDEPPVRETAGA